MQWLKRVCSYPHIVVLSLFMLNEKKGKCTGTFVEAKMINRKLTGYLKYAKIKRN